jgi:23S rRNA (guanosine2251-2'-O)-methyltransferase
MKASELVYGIHTVEYVLEHSPERILKLIVAEHRKDDRIQKLLNLAKSEKLHIEYLEKKALDHLLHGANHQGVVAECRAKKI